MKTAKTNEQHEQWKVEVEAKGLKVAELVFINVAYDPGLELDNPDKVIYISEFANDIVSHRYSFVPAKEMYAIYHCEKWDGESEGNYQSRRNRFLWRALKYYALGESMPYGATFADGICITPNTFEKKVKPL